MSTRVRVRVNVRVGAGARARVTVWAGLIMVRQSCTTTFVPLCHLLPTKVYVLTLEFVVRFTVEMIIKKLRVRARQDSNLESSDP